ncbi:MAG: glycosyltransferase [Rubripirellula sp.]
MPVRNGERYLEIAVESIRNQTFHDFEFIIVDDASTDSTPALLKAISDSRVRVITNAKASGISRSLNLAIDIARGRFIARMDADDVASPHRLAKQVDWLERHPATVLCGTFAERVDAEGSPLSKIRRPQTNVEIQWHLLTANPFIHPSVMFCAKAFRDAGRYCTRLTCAQDYDLWCRLAQQGECCNLPDPLLKYRFHDGAISANKRAEQLRITQQSSQQLLLKIGIVNSLEEGEMFQAIAGRHLTHKSVSDFARQQVLRFPEMVDGFFEKITCNDDFACKIVCRCRQRLRKRILAQIDVKRLGFGQNLDLLRIARRIDPSGMKLSSICSRVASRIMGRVNQPSYTED